jgi:hypothetical protein
MQSPTEVISFCDIKFLSLKNGAGEKAVLSQEVDNVTEVGPE